MKFISITDLIKYFMNEYYSPGNNLLIIGNLIDAHNLKQFFNFVNNELIVIDDTHSQDVDIFTESFQYLPFESYTFDLIINLKENVNNSCFINLLKPNGKILTINYSNNYSENYSESYILDNLNYFVT